MNTGNVGRAATVVAFPLFKKIFAFFTNSEAFLAFFFKYSLNYPRLNLREIRNVFEKMWIKKKIRLFSENIKKKFV